MEKLKLNVEAGGSVCIHRVRTRRSAGARVRGCTCSRNCLNCNVEWHTAVAEGQGSGRKAEMRLERLAGPGPMLCRTPPHPTSSFP